MLRISAVDHAAPGLLGHAAYSSTRANQVRLPERFLEAAGSSVQAHRAASLVAGPRRLSWHMLFSNAF